MEGPDSTGSRQIKPPFLPSKAKKRDPLLLTPPAGNSLEGKPAEAAQMPVYFQPKIPSFSPFWEIYPTFVQTTSSYMSNRLPSDTSFLLPVFARLPLLANPIL